MATRAEVYDALTSERAYQRDRWNERTTTSGGFHSLEEWLMYIEHYIGLAKVSLSTKAKQDAYVEVPHIMRKITAMGVAAMEEHGAPKREGY